MSDDSENKIAAFNAKAKKFGTAYAVFGEALGGDTLKTTVKVVQVLLLAAAAFVVGAAIWARVVG